MEPICTKEKNRTGEVNGAVVVGVNLVDHVLQLRLGGVLAQRAHDSAQLLGGDLAYWSFVSVYIFLVWIVYRRLPEKSTRDELSGTIALTIAILVLLWKKSYQSSVLGAIFNWFRSLTNREKASLYSETCSSVRESA